MVEGKEQTDQLTQITSRLCVGRGTEGSCGEIQDRDPGKTAPQRIGEAEKTWNGFGGDRGKEDYTRNGQLKV